MNNNIKNILLKKNIVLDKNKKTLQNTTNIINNKNIIKTNNELLKNHNKKSDILCITTFNNKLYNKYAHKFIDTYNFPFDLIVYSEEDMSFLKNKVKYNLTVVNSTIIIPEMNDFIKKNTERNKIDVQNMKYKGDGIRFCYKVFCVTHAGLLFTNYKYLIWLDSDIVFTNPLTDDIIEKEFINQNYMMTYLGRLNIYSECGILFFNMNHPYILKYFEEMKNMYITNKIYTLKEWHDSYIWDYVREKFEKDYNIINYSISGLCPELNVLDTTLLKNYIIHLKGKIKNKIISIA